jgi:Protein of unknown function (DUF1524)
VRLVVGVLALVLVAGCTPIDGEQPEAGGSTGGPTGNAAPPPGDVNAQLAALTVASSKSMSGYSREKFPHWRRVDENCDARDTVLKRDGTGVEATATCKITKGTWKSVYDGKSFTDPQDVDIDHMVPLANAWRSGAGKWTEEQRTEFANDLTRPQLMAVSAASNRSKGDQDPSQWKPPQKDYWCEYSRRWIAVKSFWGLTVTEREKSALEDMLSSC